MYWVAHVMQWQWRSHFSHRILKLLWFAHFYVQRSGSTEASARRLCLSVFNSVSALVHWPAVLSFIIRTFFSSTTQCKCLCCGPWQMSSSSNSHPHTKHFVTMTTGVGWGTVWKIPLHCPTPTTPLWYKNLTLISYTSRVVANLCPNSQVFITMATWVGQGPIWMTPRNWPTSKILNLVQKSGTYFLYRQGL